MDQDYGADIRFQQTWSKLGVFALTEFDRVVQLDNDMIVRQGIDELMDLDLDPPDAAGDGPRVFAASHACTCNPMKKPHYPKNW
jgi:alpha-N-acetylglucosamine transferase